MLSYALLYEGYLNFDLEKCKLKCRMSAETQKEIASYGEPRWPGIFPAEIVTDESVPFGKALYVTESLVDFTKNDRGEDQHGRKV